MKDPTIIGEIANEMGIIFPGGDFEKNREVLAAQINDWLVNNFDKLISVLYRMDISEVKLKTLLHNNPTTDAGQIIADLMMERQAAKIKSRQQYGQRENSVDEEEKW
jgi:hypothetical protein